MALSALAGAVLAALLVAVSVGNSPPVERRRYAIALVVAALVYVVFAAVGARDQLPFELIGVALFGAAAWLGAARSSLLLGAAWAAHVAWDVVLHPPGAADGVPWWYPALCIGFDLTLAGRLVVLHRNTRRAT